jgi:hypothetical protein
MPFTSAVRPWDLLSGMKEGPCNVVIFVKHNI